MAPPAAAGYFPRYRHMLKTWYDRHLLEHCHLHRRTVLIFPPTSQWTSTGYASFVELNIWRNLFKSNVLICFILNGISMNFRRRNESLMNEKRFRSKIIGELSESAFLRSSWGTKPGQEIGVSLVCTLWPIDPGRVSKKCLNWVYTSRDLNLEWGSPKTPQQVWSDFTKRVTLMRERRSA